MSQMQTSTIVKRVCVILVSAAVLILAVPQSYRQGLPGFLGSADYRLGLDLAGGTQLDFRISESEMAAQDQKLREDLAAAEAKDDGEAASTLRLELQILEQQRQNLVEAIRTVLERRINSLGVSEATITPSYVGEEKHLLVECPGVIDVQQCIATVGKTIQLEFKEEQNEATPEYTKGVRAKADAAQRQLQTNASTLEKLGQDIGNELGTGYQPGFSYLHDNLPKGLEPLWSAKPGGVKRYEGSITQQFTDENGQPASTEIPGIFLAELLSPKTMTGRVLTEAAVAFDVLSKQEKDLTPSAKKDVDVSTLAPEVQTAIAPMTAGQLKAVTLADGSAQVLFLQKFVPGEQVMDVSHILVAYKGATSAPGDVTRTKEEAKARADEAKAKLNAGGTFTALAAQYSDAESKTTGGKLGTITRRSMTPAFIDAAFALSQGAVSEVVESPFGYHIIRSDRAPYQIPGKASLDILTVKGAGAADRAAGIITRLQNGEITRQEETIKVRFLFFSLQPVGWKDTPLDGKHFRSAAVTTDPTTALPIVQISFDTEGGKLFAELTKRNVGKKLAIFVGGEMVSSPTVQGEITGGTAVITGSSTFAEAQQLAQDLNTGAIPAPIYLSGQRTVEPTLGSEAVQSSLKAGLIGAIILMLFLILVYRMLGVLGSASLLVYAAIFLALLQLPLFLITGQYVVMTLAGIAGMMLSIGLAVDANVLIFERMKEELKKNRSFKQAIELGFERAWPSIRDSNISTLITCAILFMIGTSIVRGFAITLAVGVLISLFTGLVLTRWFATLLSKTSIAERKEFFLWGKHRD